MTAKDLIASLMILNRVHSPKEYLRAEHDRIWFGTDEGCEKLTEEELEALAKLGWFPADEGGYSAFV
jgi:hypothetical protein